MYFRIFANVKFSYKTNENMEALEIWEKMRTWHYFRDAQCVSAKKIQHWLNISLDLMILRTIFLFNFIFQE